MSLLTILVVFVATAVALLLIRWAAAEFTFDPWLTRAAYGLVLFVAVVYLLRALGVFALLSSVRI